MIVLVVTGLVLMFTTTKALAKLVPENVGLAVVKVAPFTGEVIFVTCAGEADGEGDGVGVGPPGELDGDGDGWSDGLAEGEGLAPPVPVMTIDAGLRLLND